MNPETDQVPNTRLGKVGDRKPRGKFLYPGNVEDAMPEGSWARWLASYLLETILRVVVVRERDSAYANLPIYFRKGAPKKHVSPDVFYLAGVPQDPGLLSYRLWESGIPPRVVFEILSRGSKLKDRVANRAIYEELGILEYYWFDPQRCGLEALELDSATRRYRECVAKGAGRFFSAALGLEVGVEGKAIALYRDGAYLRPTEDLLLESERLRVQAELQRVQAEQQRDEEARRRVEAERRLADAETRLRDLERRRGTDEGK